MTQFAATDDPFFAEDLRQMEKAVNYRRWQFAMIAPYVRGKVLEVGGGVGNFTEDLAASAESVISLEPNHFCYEQLAQKTRHLKNVTTLNVASEALEQHVPPGYQADTLVCLNVLEHIQDDAAAVRTFANLLAPNGTVVLLVPAVPAVYGPIDQRLGHFRRYSRKGLSALVWAAGFSIEKIRYFNLVGLLGWLWNTRFAPRQKQSDGQIYFFDHYLVPWFSRIESALAPPIGQSLLAIGRKR